MTSHRWTRVLMIAALGAALCSVGACAGVLDRCADGLNPPAGGWDRHGPV